LSRNRNPETDAGMNHGWAPIGSRKSTGNLRLRQFFLFRSSWGAVRVVCAPMPSKHVVVGPPWAGYPVVRHSCSPLHSSSVPGDRRWAASFKHLSGTLTYEVHEDLSGRSTNIQWGSFTDRAALGRRQCPSWNSSTGPIFAAQSLPGGSPGYSVSERPLINFASKARSLFHMPHTAVT
jgi:hypothetical protein